MKQLTALLSVLLLAGVAGAQQQQQQQQPTKDSGTAAAAPTKSAADDLPDAASASKPQPTGPTAVFDTTMGRMTCQLFDKQAPLTVANFVGLATGTRDFFDAKTGKPARRRRYFDGTTFHRVIPNFMIQGGDPLGDGSGGPGYEFKNEQDPNLNFDVPGRLAMANAGRDTNGSQFFITEAPQPPLDQNYTIFGQCDEASVEVVKAIARVDRDSQDKPTAPVVLTHVTIVPVGEALPPAPALPAAPKPAAIH